MFVGNNVLLLASWLLAFKSTRTLEQNFYEKPGVTAGEIIKARGFKTEEIHLLTEDGYQLKLVRAWNPLVANNREPILFVHGILEDSGIFVINSFNARPRDFTSVDLCNSSLAEMIAQDPSASSLPLLAMNFGHEVWLLNRRGAPGSRSKISQHKSPGLSNEQTARQQKESSTSYVTWGAFTSAPGALLDFGTWLHLLPFSFDQNFWNFSFDEQAKYDIPLVVTYISDRGGGSNKVAVVSHSAGGALALMSLATQPKLADKISSSIFWSQGFTLGKGDSFAALQPARPFFEAYIGSVPPALLSTQIQAILGLFCATSLAQRTLCEAAGDLLFGASGGREPMKPQYINSVLYSTSSHELAQNLQNVASGGIMHMYNYGSSEANWAKYNQSQPPAYDLSRVTLDRMSFYVGRTDSIVSEEDVRYSSSLLNVPHQFHLMDTTFNHQGYFYHENNSRLVIIPTLKEINKIICQQNFPN